MKLSKTLELSTGNLTQADCDALSSLSHKSEIKGSDEFSVMVSVSEYHQEELKHLRSLVPIMDYAMKNDIRYINFDRDNEISSEFEEFDW